MTRTEERSASGELQLYYKFEEYDIDFEYQAIEQVSIKTLDDKNIIMNIHLECDRLDKSEFSYIISFSELIDIIRAKALENERNKKIEMLTQLIFNWNPGTQSAQELYEMLITANQYEEFNGYALRPNICFIEPKDKDTDDPWNFSFAETIQSIDLELQEIDFVIGCDSKGNCVIQHDFDFFDDKDCSNDLTLKHISEIWSKLEEWKHFCYVSSKDD